MSAPPLAPRPRSVAILGCGLIGGSLGLALKRGDPALEVVGIDRSSVIDAAMRRGAIDRGFPPARLERALRDQQALVLGLPMSALLTALDGLADLELPQLELILDVAGVKAPVLARAGAVGLTNFVGGHPMAGGEQGGIEAATPGLFDDRPFVLCPLGPGPSPLRRAVGLVQAAGARALVLDPETHDRAVGLTSHLPHLVAQALMACASAFPSPDSELPWALAAGSWRDATRVAESDPGLWAELFAANAAGLGAALDPLIELLTQARDRLRDPATATTPIDDPQSLRDLRAALRARLPPVEPP